jgi:hypothetical protein
MPNRVIEDYQPDDEGWGVVVGRLAPKPEQEPRMRLATDEDLERFGSLVIGPVVRPPKDEAPPQDDEQPPAEGD